MAAIHRIIIILVVVTIIFVPLFGQRSEKQSSAWEALLARDPGAADDSSLGWRERLALHALTPEQKEAWAKGASEESLYLENGQTLRAYLEERLSPPAGVYVALPVPCRLFASEGIEAGTRYGIRARGEDLAAQGGSAGGCGIPAEATALILQLRLEARQPGRLKLWAGDGPEPAESVIQTEDWNVPVRQGTAVVTLAAQGAPEADLVLRATASSEVSGEVVGYFRSLTAEDQPGGRILLYTEGEHNNFFGTGAGASITTGASNSFFGGNAGNGNTTGYWNSFFGTAAGYLNSEGIRNSFFGTLAGRHNITGSDNSFFGTQAGYSNTATGNSFFGYYAGHANTSASGNAFFGREAGRANTASYNSFFGDRAGYSNTSGRDNAFFGWAAGYSNTTGGYSTFFGDSAGYSNTTGNYNAFFGDNAGLVNTTGSANSFIGQGAGYSNTTGNDNSFIGRGAGLSNTTEHNNSFIGALSNGTAGITNATALGYRARVSQANSLVLGSIAGVNGATAYVNVGIGTEQPNRQLHIAGPNAVFRMDRTQDTASFLLVRVNAAGSPLKSYIVGTNASGVNQGEFIINDMGAAVGGAGSRRMTITNTGAVQFTGTVSAAGFINTSSLAYKTNVRTFDHALETVGRLRGVRFDWKESGEAAVGLIAEEVAEVVPELVSQEDGAPSGVSYANLVAVLVEAVKEQQTASEAQQRTITEQQEALKILRAELEKVKALLSR
jgi:hypothetical protein